MLKQPVSKTLNFAYALGLSAILVGGSLTGSSWAMEDDSWQRIRTAIVMNDFNTTVVEHHNQKLEQPPKSPTKLDSTSSSAVNIFTSVECVDDPAPDALTPFYCTFTLRLPSLWINTVPQANPDPILANAADITTFINGPYKKTYDKAKSRIEWAATGTPCILRPHPWEFNQREHFSNNCKGSLWSALWKIKTKKSQLQIDAELQNNINSMFENFKLLFRFMANKGY